MAKITIIAGCLLLLLAVSAAAPAEKEAVQTREDLIAPVAPAETKEDLVAAEKEDLKPAASHYGGLGYGGYGYGGYGHFGGHYPYYSSYWGYPGWGYGGYGGLGGYGGYGWPYGGWGYGHGGYWW